ncbi:MAG TPA: type II secretion system protein GspM [Nitrospiria bacterium]|nr:type II secretion system protein GspM [Nitrospiria bacterium]
MTAIGDLWKRLSWREQLVLGWGGVIVLGLVIYMTAVDPLLQRMAMLDRLIPQKQRELDQLNQMREDYGRLKGRVDADVKAMGADFSLATFAEKTVLDKVGKPHLAGIKPQPDLPFENYQEVSVEVRLEQVQLAQIVSFLSGLEQAPQRLRVKRIEIKSRFNEPDLLDAAITVAVYQLKAGQLQPGPTAGAPAAPGGAGPVKPM